MEEHQFLPAFLIERCEVLLMGSAEIGENCYGRLDDVTQSPHLASLADASLEDANLRLVVHEPHGERHANLRVVAAGRPRHGKCLFRLGQSRQNLIQPLFSHGLTIRTGDAYYRHAELLTMALGQSLQGTARIGDEQEVGIAIGCQVGRERLDHEVMNAAAVEVGDELVPVVASCVECEKQCFLRET